MEEVRSDEDHDDDDEANNRKSSKNASVTAQPTTPSAAKSKKKKSRRSERSENDNLLKQALVYSRGGATAITAGPGVSTPSMELVKGVHAKADDEGAEIRATAAALLRHLIVDKQESLRAHFHKIPFMPQARQGWGEAGFVSTAFGNCEHDDIQNVACIRLMSMSTLRH